MADSNQIHTKVIYVQSISHFENHKEFNRVIPLEDLKKCENCLCQHTSKKVPQLIQTNTNTKVLFCFDMFYKYK
jgi:hypothetical protein